MGDLTNLKIYASRDYFTILVRNMFTNVGIKHQKEDAYRWKTPSIAFWPQRLNFVIWCATSGCGVAANMLKDDQTGSFLRFHVAFTIRRLLYELRSPLPGDNTFDPVSLSYDKAAYERISKEFGAPKDFRFTHGSNGG